LTEKNIKVLKDTFQNEKTNTNILFGIPKLEPSNFLYNSLTKSGVCDEDMKALVNITEKVIKHYNKEVISQIYLEKLIVNFNDYEDDE
jgi:hypothetical protein